MKLSTPVDVNLPNERLVETDRIAGSASLLRDLIAERLGLSFDDHDGVRVIINKLLTRLEPSRCQSFLEYYYLLMSGSADADVEWRVVMSLLAKSKSGFWRHRDVVRTLVDVAVPRLHSTLRSEPLRIWSASCATGEEPLSIAIALKEAGWFECANIEIVASDASYAVIESAKAGVHSEERISNLDVRLRDKYFAREEGGWRVAPELQAMIQWKVANLMDPNEVASLARSHVIFCQNVFIYFSGHAICKTLALFGRCMPAGAYLFSDHGEFFTTLVSSSKLFEPLGSGESDVWVRTTTATR